MGECWVIWVRKIQEKSNRKSILKCSPIAIYNIIISNEMLWNEKKCETISGWSIWKCENQFLWNVQLPTLNYSYNGQRRAMVAVKMAVEKYEWFEFKISEEKITNGGFLCLPSSKQTASKRK